MDECFNAGNIKPYWRELNWQLNEFLCTQTFFDWCDSGDDIGNNGKWQCGDEDDDGKLYCGDDVDDGKWFRGDNFGDDIDIELDDEFIALIIDFASFSLPFSTRWM